MAQPPPTADPTTVVPVHGAVADASNWSGVIQRLQRQGHTVLAQPIRRAPGRRHRLHRQRPHPAPGSAAAGRPRRRRRGHHQRRHTGKQRGRPGLHRRLRPPPRRAPGRGRGQLPRQPPQTAQAQRADPTRQGGRPPPEFLVDPARFREVVAADLPAEPAAVLAATQRPVAAAAFSESSGPPAEKTLPSRAVAATADKAAGTDVIRPMAKRAGATITEVQSAHLITISQPQAVTDLIVKATRAVSPAGR
jgi:hypothetical protein